MQRHLMAVRQALYMLLQETVICGRETRLGNFSLMS